MIVLVLGILSINNIILTIRNYSYAYFEKNVKTGVKLKITTLDEMPVKGSPSANTLKEKLVPYATASKSNFEGGLVAINTDGNLYNENDDSQSIREYRYTGLNVNNYIYYNCKDGADQNTGNCEVWRIIGIFKDEDGNEHLKIVRNNVLTSDMFPTTFIGNGVTYNIQSTTTGNYAYWNKKSSGKNNNDWATAGLQYWLNAGRDKESKTPSDGYISYLSKNAQTMIKEVSKYYLGTVTYQSKSSNDYGITENSKDAYIHERDVSSCINNIGSNITTNGCRVWDNNQATWEGNIALMYPSDYGYSANISYWNISLKYGSFNGTASNSSWLQKGANQKNPEWLLSPSSYGTYGVSTWDSTANVHAFSVTDSGGVRPCLYLKSEVKIIDGDGSSEKPYKIKIGN